jgi:hypothetical protein
MSQIVYYVLNEPCLKYARKTAKFIKSLSQLKKAESRFQDCILCWSNYYVVPSLRGRYHYTIWCLSISIRIGDSLGPGKGSKPSPCDFDHYGASLMMDGE